jgi:hypothetical protein
LQSRTGVAREDIVAARRERRQKAKAARDTPATTPPRYRKKRDTGGAVAIEEPYAGAEELVDPLDAQRAGLHDAALEQGHEEIALNFEELDEHRGEGGS